MQPLDVYNFLTIPPSGCDDFLLWFLFSSLPVHFLFEIFSICNSQIYQQAPCSPSLSFSAQALPPSFSLIPSRKPLLQIPLPSPLSLPPLRLQWDQCLPRARSQACLLSTQISLVSPDVIPTDFQCLRNFVYMCTNRKSQARQQSKHGNSTA